jgi:rhodanese-related sulfurtransferase
MGQESLKTAAQLVAEAKSRTENLTPDQVAAEVAAGNVVLVDLREPAERTNDGTIPGAVHAPRGMLEFYADPTSPYHRPEFDPSGRVILHCASGGRSALAADTLRGMGYGNVAHLDGGIKAWKETGHEIEDAGAT